jgi:hypothetical protein
MAATQSNDYLQILLPPVWSDLAMVRMETIGAELDGPNELAASMTSADRSLMAEAPVSRYVYLKDRFRHI